MRDDVVQHVFLVGAKSLGNYGGYETFVNKLTEYHQNDDRIKYHVACKANGNGCMDPYKTNGVQIINEFEFNYHNAQCFRIKIPEKIGSVQAIYYDVAALIKCCEIIKKESIPHPIVYIMACRIGPFMKYFYYKIHKFGGRVYLNPDGHEWKRNKWSPVVRKYWKWSEQMMVRWSDLVICDSRNIENYIHRCYARRGKQGYSLRTTFIAYGAETRKSKLTDSNIQLLKWYEQKGLVPHEYYLVVGRFVPENNYETMIREFINSGSRKKFAIITDVNDKFLNELDNKVHFRDDYRINFVGTVYDTELLMKIRENAYAYIHGHEVGGTNPSLLEALASTNLNLVLDVDFNREVAGNAAMYWSKGDGNLASIIDIADGISLEKRKEYGKRAKQRIEKAYSWKYICERYAEEFLNT